MFTHAFKDVQSICPDRSKMRRRLSDGRRSLIDLVAEFTQTTQHNAAYKVHRMLSKGVIPDYERVTTGAGKATPYVSDDEWYHVRSQLPPKAPDDLYVMENSNRDGVVQVGRSRVVEARR